MLKEPRVKNEVTKRTQGYKRGYVLIELLILTIYVETNQFAFIILKIKILSIESEL